jgi:ABC-2 type transport system ATP-binding protein
MAILLEANRLTKNFRNQWTMRLFCALDGLDLALEPGEIFGLIGPNGAGKTTTFKLILGLLRPSSGSVTFQGEPLGPAARTSIGFLPEQPYFYDYLTVRETLDLYARLYGLDRAARRRRVEAVVEAVHLGHKIRAPLRTLSKGTLQRVGIAQAILNEPRLVILDEPMSGLDPAGRRQMRELILSLRGAGSTVIFSSHILPDAEMLCDRVGILTGGRMREIVGLHRGQDASMYVLTVRGVDGPTLEKLEKLARQQPVVEGESWNVRLAGPDSVGSALDIVRAASGLVESLVPVHPSLEERFLSHVGEAAHID